MITLTLTLDDDVARWVHARAGERNVTISRLLGDLLRVEMNRDSRHNVLQRDYFAGEPRPIGSGRVLTPDRSALHDRTRLR